jgi:uncharacterized OB-fold protein
MSKRHSSKDNDLLLFRCAGGHVCFYPHERCPECDLDLAELRQPAAAWIVSQTTVRVNPTGLAFRLGIARVACGAKTLCLIEDGVPPQDNVPVTLENRDGLYHAVSP